MKKIFFAVLGILLVLPACGSMGSQSIRGVGLPVLDIPETKPLSDVEPYTKGEPGISGGIILEDDEAIYLCSTLWIIRIEKESKESQILWESANVQNNEEPYRYMLCEGTALLWKEKIYFIERWDEKPGWKCHVFLSAINCDGSGYEVIGELKEFSSASLYLKDEILYVTDYVYEEYYRIFDNERLVKIEEEEAGIHIHMPKDCFHVGFYRNGHQYLSIAESIGSCGYALIRDPKGGYVKLWPGMEEEKTNFSGKIFLSLNEDYFLTSLLDEHEKFYLTDRNTWETNLLIELELKDENIGITDMNKNCACVKRVLSRQDGLQYVYEKLDLNTGKDTVLFSQCYESLIPATLSNGFVYYTEKENGKWYLARRELEDPSKEERLGEPFYDSGLSKVGTMDCAYEWLYDKGDPDVLLAKIDAKWLKVDSRFPGAEKINQKLREEEETAIAGMKENAVKDLSGEKFKSTYYSYTSIPSSFFVMYGRYVSFYQDKDYYLGGAHGLPVRCEYTFDLMTGQQLELRDIIENSEEELRELVTTYFAEYMGEDSDYFWKDALSIVEENTDYGILFYLTEKGITFEFSPYTVASYAAGYQSVTIPYEEFDMKLPISGESQP